MALYLWTWPPAVLLLGIFGVYFIIQLSADFLRGRSPDHIAFAGAISMGVTGLLLFLPFNAFVIRATEFSLLQPLLALGIAFGCVFMAWLAREFEARELDGRLYPLSIVGIIGAMALLVVLVAPNVWEYLLKNIIRVVGLGTNAQARTVGEAQPLSEPMLQFFFAFGLTFVSAGVAALAILFYHLRRPNPSTESLLVVVWAVFLLLAALTQQRFTYYLVLPIAVLNAFLVRLIVEYITPSGRAEDIETFQILTVVTILIVIVAPMAMATSSGLAGKPAWEQGNSNQPDLGTLGWNSGLHWMHNNTPIPGTYGGADNAMEFEETTQRVGDHDYPPGAYGVMSWWDYGHWITERSERIPNANPFQQGSTTAANFLLAPNETRANEILEEVDEDDAETRYVMIDWKMISTQSRSPVNGKFFAPIVFYDDGNVTSQDMWNRVINPTRRVDYRVKSQRYYESMVNRLWHFHGSSQEPRPVVFDYEERQVRQNGEIRTVHITPTGNQSAYHQFDGLTREQAMEQARAYVANDSSSQIGGVGPNPPEYVEALEHYRLVGGSETPALSRGYPYAVQLQNTILGLMPNNVSGQNESVAAQRELQNVVFPDSTVPPWVKIFERVPGGTIEGTGPANSTVSASVQIRTPSGSGNFTYSQRAQTDSDGYFEMTVPYSTTGYDEWGTAEGYTDVDAKATGPYRLAAISENETHITRYTGTANVTEGQVIGEDDSSTTVAFDEQSLEKAQQEDLADGSSQTDDSSTDDGSTDDSSTDDGSTDDSSTDGSSGNETGGTAERVAPPATVATP
jgi:dolichyl-diphosphooligosaccharide--protein glycosyltransferase